MITKPNLKNSALILWHSYLFLSWVFLWVKKMQRREFLKAMISLLTLPALNSIPDFILVDESFNNENYIDAGFNVRELIAYDLYSDTYLSRYDISTKTDHYCVTCALNSKSEIQQSRNDAILLLKELMTKEGIEINDLIHLPVPGDYIRPKDL